MHYTYITMDVGAAIKVLQVMWNNSIMWSGILIYPRHFNCVLMFLFGH